MKQMSRAMGFEHGAILSVDQCNGKLKLFQFVFDNRRVVRKANEYGIRLVL